PADFAYSELRFKKHFKPLPDNAENPILVADYIEMDTTARENATPFIYTTGAEGNLVKIQVSPSIVKLTEQCREYWTFLQYLAGQDLAAARKAQADLEKKLTETRDDAAKSQEEMIELMAKAMAEVAATGTTTTPLPFLGGFGGGANSTGGASGSEESGSAPAGSGTPFRYELEKIAQCTDCKTCY
ncbi:pyruvate-flavodoxin oxidoreductase, partial [Mobiluncus curtisii]|nr:pyruvate-flavodoxin oxidoreductase [Mobiluncus curtisii]